MYKAEKEIAKSLMQKFILDSKKYPTRENKKTKRDDIFRQLTIQQVSILCNFNECNVTKLAGILGITLPRRSSIRPKNKKSGNEFPFISYFACFPYGDKLVRIAEK